MTDAHTSFVEWGHPQHTVTWAIPCPLGPVVGIMGGHSPLYAQHGTTNHREQDRGQRTADRSLGICLPCLLTSLHHSGSPQIAWGSPAWPSSEATPRLACGCQGSRQRKGCSKSMGKKGNGRTWSQFSSTRRSLPTHGCFFWKTGHGSPSFPPSENLLSVTGQMARTCALCEFR